MRWQPRSRLLQSSTCQLTTRSSFRPRTRSPCVCCLAMSFARVARAGQEVRERSKSTSPDGSLATESPVAALEPRVEPRVYERDGFAMTLWTYYEPRTPQDDVSPADYAQALERLHDGMRRLDVAAPHFTDRVAEAQQLVASGDRTPALADAGPRAPDRAPSETCDTRSARAARPSSCCTASHIPGTSSSTQNGLLFIDLETCCRGPVEFDLAHAPEEVSECYPGADQELVSKCRQLVLAMVAAWRWDRDDEFPNGERAGRADPEAATRRASVAHTRRPARQQLVARHRAPGDVLVDPHVAGQAEHALAEDVAHHLGRAALDRVRP